MCLLYIAGSVCRTYQGLSGTQSSVADFAGRPFQVKGGTFVARERPTASHVPALSLTCLDGADRGADAPRLTRAEAHALRRSAAMTHARLREHLDVLLPAGHTRA